MARLREAPLPLFLGFPDAEEGAHVPGRGERIQPVLEQGDLGKGRPDVGPAARLELSGPQLQRKARESK